MGTGGLDPDLDEARRLLREELQDARYAEPFDPLAWLFDRFADVRDWLAELGAGGSVLAVVAVVALLLLLAGVVALIARSGRASHRVRPADGGDVGLEPGVTAAEYLARARAALAEDRPGPALADAFRSVAVDAAERTLLDDVPSRTAQEITGALAGTFPDHGAALLGLGSDFDDVVYGGRAVGRERAASAIALAQTLHAARPRLAEAT